MYKYYSILKSSLIQTTNAWPSQWEGKSLKSEKVYIRFRHGILTVDINEKQKYRKEVSKLFGDGIMDTEHLLKFLKDSNIKVIEDKVDVS